MWALAHPLRFRLFELLVEGPSTASRLARELGEWSGSTSYHLRRLARAGAIVEAPELGTRRERWWRRRERLIQVPTDADLEGRAMSARMFGILFARDEEARHGSSPATSTRPGTRPRMSATGSSTSHPQEADELGVRFFELLHDIRTRASSPPGAARALISFSVLPWLE